MSVYCHNAYDFRTICDEAQAEAQHKEGPFGSVLQTKHLFFPNFDATNIWRNAILLSSI